MNCFLYPHIEADGKAFYEFEVNFGFRETFNQLGKRENAVRHGKKIKLMQAERQRAKKENLKNVKTVLSRENKIPLPARTIDYCLLSSVVHEMENAVLFFRELKRLLKDKGRIGIIEWKKVSSPLGPPLTERISAAAMKRTLIRNGFRPAKTLVLGRYNYGIVADRKERP